MGKGTRSPLTLAPKLSSILQMHFYMFNPAHPQLGSNPEQPVAIIKS